MSTFSFKRISIYIHIVIALSFANHSLTLAIGEELKLISPNGNEKLQINTQQGIAWVSKSIVGIDILFSVNNGSSWNKIADNIDAKLGTYSWKIPNLPNQKAIIKIVSHSNQNIVDISDASFGFSKNISIKGNLKKISKANSTTVILPLGNSITYDNRANDTRPPEEKAGYREHLYELLSNGGFDFSFTGSEHSGGNKLPVGFDNNAGFPGIRDSQLTNLLRTGWRRQPQHSIDQQITFGPYLNTYPADIVLLHIGTNDNDKADGTLSIDVENILDHIDSINTETIVILARIIDRVPNQSYVTTFNDNIETMALDRVNNPANDAYPDKIVMVDMQNSANLDYTIDSMGTVGNGVNGDMNDEHHPNDKGYYKMAEVWFEAISSLLATAPVIAMQPKDVNIIENQSAQFSVTVGGTKPFTYQWKKDGSNISGATNTIYVIPSVSISDNNSHFSCAITNSEGTITSHEATLFVTGENERTKRNLLVEYNFEDESNKVADVSGIDTPLNLTIANTGNIKWVPYGLEITNPTIVSATGSTNKIFNSPTTSREISLEAWLKPSNTSQSGPSRIMTFSKDGHNRNFTLGQEANKYVVRLTTTSTSTNGEPSLSSDGSLTTDLTHIVYTRDSIGNAKIYINGEVNTSVNVGGDFSVWDNTFSFGLANEFTTDRNWLGTYYLAAIYSRALNVNEVEHNYSVGFNGMGNILIPPNNLAAHIKNDTIVNLTWQDNSNEELGYIVERRANSLDSVYFVIDTLGENSNSYSDLSPKHITSYIYRVKAYNGTFISDYSDSVKVDNIVSIASDNSIPYTFKLYQNYPNPFNPSTTIKYSIPKRSNVSLFIYDILGKAVTSLVNNSIIEVGTHSYMFQASTIENNLTSGIYFYRLIANPIDGSEVFIETKKLLLVK